jgi:murein DD-endopeptidase MepM/ murein hydrolase activator NlpD
MQAQLVRLDALGERLVDLAGLEQGEFNFEDIPAVGGPAAGYGESSSVGARDLLSELDRLTQMLQDRELQLDLLEDLIMSRNLQEVTQPSGRPVTNGWISSRYGNRTDPFSGKKAFHKGIDFAGKAGAQVVAVAAGVVSAAESHSGYGKLVEINHGGGLVTRYGHCKEILVEVGDTVSQGQVIASMGSTGRSTGPHVHFEVIRNGNSVNPAKYVTAAR